MQEIVTKVLEAEKAAGARIQEARSKAGEIRAQADQEVEATVQEARERAGKRSQEVLSEARSQAQEEYEEAVEQARGENQAFFKRHEEDINRAVESVLVLITSPEWAQSLKP
jgi:V/A-type H+-transporting ATPase subunit G/H